MRLRETEFFYRNNSYPKKPPFWGLLFYHNAVDKWTLSPRGWILRGHIDPLKVTKVAAVKLFRYPCPTWYT
jgi:hypothetical protein